MFRKYSVAALSLATSIAGFAAGSTMFDSPPDLDTVTAVDAAAHANWASEGDKVEVCDDQDDGWGAKVDVAIREPGTTKWIDKFTVNDPKSTDNCTVAAKNVTEDWEVRIRLYLYKGDEIGVETFMYSTT